MTLFVVSCIIPLFGLWLASTPLPLVIKGPLIGILTVGVPEVLAIVAIALLGRQVFDRLKDKVFSCLKKMAPQGSVSRMRYRIGLILFIVPFIPNYIMGYAPHLLPDNSSSRLYVNIGADLCFFTSLFVLGGDFWDKLKALFIFDAKTLFPPSRE
jgi:hypothetical protein